MLLTPEPLSESTVFKALRDRVGGHEQRIIDLESAGQATNALIYWSTVQQWGGGTAKSGAQNRQAVLAAAAAGVAILQFGSGTFNFDTGFTIAGANSFRISGNGVSSKGTLFRFANATGDDITFTNSQHVGISGVWFYPVVRKTSGYAIKFDAGSFYPTVEQCRFDYGYNAIFAFSGAEMRFHRNMIRYMHGTRGIQMGGSAGAGVYRVVIDDLICDNPYQREPGTRITWTASTAVALGQVTMVNGKVWQCVAAGTTGTSAPDVVPGTNSYDAFVSANFTDGAVQWRFICADDLRWVVQDSYAYSVVLNKLALIDGIHGFTQMDSVNSGSSWPIWVFGWDVECDHSYTTCIRLVRGEGAYFNGSWWGSCLTGNAMFIAPSHRGEVFVGGGTRIMGNWQNGVLSSAGPIRVKIMGAFIGANSQQGSGLFNGITFAAGASKFSVIANTIGLLPSGSNLQGYAVSVEAGASDRYKIALNDTDGNVLGDVSDGGTGANKYVAANF